MVQELDSELTRELFAEAGFTIGEKQSWKKGLQAVAALAESRAIRAEQDAAFAESLRRDAEREAPPTPPPAALGADQLREQRLRFYAAQPRAPP